MVHRPADSRLLTNLLSQEKEYTKQLSQVLDSSNASLASFSAYAAASPPPTSTVIMSVVGSLAAADEALRRYTRGVEEWREMMKLLKEAEDEVGNIVRDREILVNRLLKASKSERKSSNTNFRDSLLLGHNRLPSSSSSLSLSVGNPESPSPSPSRPLSASFNTSSKLAAAQAELQACENHLATKERELALKRCATVRDGLGLRIRALMECGWVWAEVGKQALQVLEELKVDSEMEQQHPSLPVSVSSPSRRPPLSGIGERRISSLLETSEDHAVLHEDEDEREHEPDHEHDHDHDHEPSSDLSSISPSQSASQRGDGEPLPPPISIGTLLRQLDPNAVGEPSGSGPVEGEASTLHQPQDTVPAEDEHEPQSQRDSLQVQHQSMRSSGFSMATTTSSVYYSPAQPATYKVETMTYAPAVALHVPGTSSGKGASKGKGKEKEREGDVEGLPVPAADVPPPASSELFKESVQLHTTMRIPAPHAMNDEYAYRIPTAHQTQIQTPSPPSTVEHHPSPSGSGPGQQGRRRSFTGSPSRPSQPQTQPSSTSYARSNLSQPQHHPQLFSITAPRRVLERRITEEDIRKLSTDKASSDGEAGSSLEEEETRDETKLVKEGKLEVVENPRFMSEERKREVERERRRREEAERKRKEKEEREAREREVREKERGTKEREGTKEKKRFGFFHSSSPSRSQTHPQPQAQPQAEHPAEEGEQHVRFTDESAGDSPSKLKHPSPSKGRFLGGLKTFFGGKQGSGSGQTPSSSPLASPVTSGHGHSRSLSLPRANSDLGAGAASSSEDEDEEEDSDVPGSGKRSGGFALFGGRKKGKSKSKKKERAREKEKDHVPSGRWSTRTDKNIRDIVERRGSYDAAIPSLFASNTASGSIGRSLGRGIASDAVLNAGRSPIPSQSGGSVRNRTMSDVGVSTPASSIGVAGGRRLRKPRSGAVLGGGPGGGGGSPTEPASAAAGGASGHAQESSGSTTTSAGGANKSTSPPKVPSSILKSRSSIPAPLAARRSASVDDSASLSRRKSWVGEYEEEDGEEGEEEDGEGDGMIVDLGWRRRTASEVTPSPTRGTGPSAAKPVKSALVKPKSLTPLLDQSGKAKDYSSDTAAMTSASAVSSQGGVKRKKSLTKKRGQGPATATTTSSAAVGGDGGPASGVGSTVPSPGTTGAKAITIPPMPATMPPVPTAPPPPSSSLGSGGLLNPPPTAPSTATSSATSTPTKKPGLKPPSSVSSSPYGTQGSHRGSQSMSTLATVLPANKNIDRPSGVPQSSALTSSSGAGGGNANGGLSRNSSITSAASAPPRVGGGAGKGGRHLKQSSLGQGITSATAAGGRGGGALGAGGGGGPGSRLVRRSSLGMVPTTSSSVSAASTPSKIPSKATPSATSNANQQSLMSIIDGVSRANKEGSTPSTSKTKMLKSVGGTQKPSGLVELGSVKAPERVKREALESMEEKGMASTSSLATVTPANVKDAKAKLGSGPGSGSGLFEIKAPGSVFEARDLNLPEPQAQAQAQAQPQPQPQSSTSVTLAQPQPQKALAVPGPRKEPQPQPQPGQRHPPSPEEDLQIWATGTVPAANGSFGGLTSRGASGASGSGLGNSRIPVKAPSPSPSQLQSHSPSPKPSSPSPLRSVLKNPTSRSPSPGAAASVGAGGRLNGVQQIGPVSVSPAPRDNAPPPADATLPWGSDGSLKQPEGTTGVDSGKGKEKEQDVVPPSPSDDVDGTSDTETYETGNESFSEHEQEEEPSREEQHHEMPAPAVIVSQADSPSTSKLPNGVANGHAVGYDHGGSPKTSSVLSQAQSDTSTVRGAPQALQPPPATAGSATGSTSYTVSGPRRRKSVRVSLQPTYSPSPPAIEYTPDEEQKEFSPWAPDESQKRQHAEREQQRAGYHHPHHPLPKPTTIATQLLSSSRTAQPAPHSTSAVHAASGEVERVRDMWADSSESEDEQYKRAKRLLSRAAKKEKDVHLLVANRTR